MMDKQRFLDSLGKRLLVLEEKERSDILGEYSQHIDMKVKSGLTEEEAIGDFGDLDDLVEEILEAYHVDPDYAENEQKAQWKERPQDDGPEPAGSAERKGHFVSGLSALCGKAVSWLSHVAGRAGTVVGRTATVACGQVSRAAARWSSWLKRKISSIREAWRRFRTGSSRKRGTRKGYAGNIVVYLMKVTVWICWIGVLLCLIVPVAALGLFLLFGLAVLVTFLLQGYPVIGVTVGCLGLVCCCLAVTGVLTSFWGRLPVRRRDIAGAEEKTIEKEQEALG